MLEQNSKTEDTLILLAIQGDRNAYGELVCRYYNDVIRVVYRLCSDSQIAQDATQEAFLKAWVKLPDFQPRSPFRNWLYRIAVNAALDILRKKPDESIDDHDETLVMADKMEGPEGTYIEKEQVNLLQEAVKVLPEGARTVLVLREYAGLSYGEIASVLDIPIGTVMSRLNYSRTCLREKLQSYHLEMEREYA